MTFMDAAVVSYIVFVFLCIAAWLTNVIWIFKILLSTQVIQNNTLILAIITGCIPPFGVVHGWVIWFKGWTGF